MSAVFAELGLEQMPAGEGALRDGVGWDLLGGSHPRDSREVTIDRFAQTYHVDLAQAGRVRELALQLLKDIAPDAAEPLVTFLDWAARLHEIGMSIAQGAYHKHSAYILAFADMPGFSRLEHGYLSTLVLAQRGKLSKMREAFDDDPRLATLAFCLRVAVIFHRSRRTLKLPRLAVSREPAGFLLEIDSAWLADHSLVAVALDSERAQWDSVGLSFAIGETLNWWQRPIVAARPR